MIFSFFNRQYYLGYDHLQASDRNFFMARKKFRAPCKKCSLKTKKLSRPAKSVPLCKIMLHMTFMYI